MQITMQFKLFDATMHKNAKKKLKIKNPDLNPKNLI